MYDPDNKYDFLTEHEKLHEKIALKRLLTLLKGGTLAPSLASIDKNSYGEWVFVRATYKNNLPPLMFYSNFGYHFFKEKWLTDESFTFYASFASPTTQPTTPEVETMVNAWLKESKEMASSQTQTKAQKKWCDTYDAIKDICCGDEDATISTLKDLPIKLD